MKLNLHPFELQLKHPFTISRETITTQPTLIVELQDESVSGYGEATANQYYGRDIARMQELLTRFRHKIESVTWDHPAELWQALGEDLGGDPFAQCALDQAAYDLWGKLKGKSVLELLGWTFEMPRPVSNYTLGIDTLQKLQEKLAEFPDWSIYKIKLGTEHDLDILNHLRTLTAAQFRVDANGGWSVEEALRVAPQLARLGVELIEQPLHADRIADMPQLKGCTTLPIIADENCQVPADVKRCAEAGFDGINIKLVKCGGLTPALEMMKEARQLGLKIMVGCMTESSVGISAIAQLLPGLDFVDMDGAVLLANDIAQGVTLERGTCIYPPGVFGSGVHQLRKELAL